MGMVGQNKWERKMVFQGVEYWNDKGIIHNFKLWDTSKSTIRDYLNLEAELKLDWYQLHGNHVPIRMMVDVSQVGYIPTELFLTYTHPQIPSNAVMPVRYIAYISDHITHQLLFHRVAQSGGDAWRQHRQLFAPKDVINARNWLYNVSKAVAYEPIAMSR
jgi:hypothetical protein